MLEEKDKEGRRRDAAQNASRGRLRWRLRWSVGVDDAFVVMLLLASGTLHLDEVDATDREDKPTDKSGFDRFDE